MNKRRNVNNGQRDKKMVDSNSSRETGVFYLFPFGKFLKFCRFFHSSMLGGMGSFTLDELHDIFFNCKDMVLY